jgi:hypothetical protein
MQPYAKSLLTATVLLLSVGSWAQEVYHFNGPDLLARLSYDSSPVVQRDGVRHVCVAVSHDGDYRIVRSLNSGQAQRLQGKIPQEQFQQLKTLLGSADFRALSGSHGGLIFQESESFAAEIPMRGWQRESATQRLQWLNANGESPFPDSVAKVVDWLKHFEPTDGKLFVYAEYPDVCPSGRLRLLQPSVADNLHP